MTHPHHLLIAQQNIVLLQLVLNVLPLFLELTTLGLAVLWDIKPGLLFEGEGGGVYLIAEAERVRPIVVDIAQVRLTLQINTRNS